MNPLLHRCATLVAAAWLAACAPVPVAPDGASLFVDSAFAPPGRPIDPAQVFALSPEMRQYLAHEIDDRVNLHGLQQGLIDALYSSNQKLVLEYDAEFTRNAAEAFDARAGNCLSLAIMTGAFAKALGLAVRYRAVQIDDSWGRDGDLALFVGHVNVSVGKKVPLVRTVEHSPDWWTVDFLPQADIRRQRTVPVAEERIVAMYMNNKAAEALARGRNDDAYWWIRTAITQDPRFADLYNTLGVVYMRHGQPQPAEAALRAALGLRAEHPQVLSNLALLLRRQGRQAEASAVDQQLARLRAQSPFASFNRGLRAYEAGDYAQAREQFERALAMSNDFHEFHYWMALACLRLGERERAIRHLREAEQNSNTRQQQAAYAMKLQRLAAAGAPGSGASPPGR
jgi:Flp pilus assembly protein TadD